MISVIDLVHGDLTPKRNQGQTAPQISLDQFEILTAFGGFVGLLNCAL